MLETWRCRQCQHILAQVSLSPGSVIVIKCGCNAYNTLEVAAASTNGHGSMNALSMLAGAPSTGYVTGER